MALVRESGLCYRSRLLRHVATRAAPCACLAPLQRTPRADISAGATSRRDERCLQNAAQTRRDAGGFALLRVQLAQQTKRRSICLHRK